MNFDIPWDEIQDLVMDPEFSLKAVDCIASSIGLLFWMLSDGLSGTVQSAITYGAFTGGMIVPILLLYGYLKEDRNTTIEDVLQGFFLSLSLVTCWIFFGVATIECGLGVNTINPYTVVYGAALVSTVSTGIDLVWKKIK